MDNNKFRSLLGTGKIPLGTWLMSGAPSTAEALGHRFDFLVVDMEHTPIGVPDAVSLLRAVGCTPAAHVVRLPWNDSVLVKRMLDGGAKTLMFPFIQNAEEAGAAVASTRYPPAGIRGIAGMHRGNRYGHETDFFAHANDDICVILQLETTLAVSRLAEIAAVPGVDALFIGPSDLAGDMGHIGRIGEPAVQTALREAAEAAGRAGKPVGIVGPTAEMVAGFIGYGYNWTAIASDLGFMLGGAQAALGALRKVADAKAARK